jgi:hypothetical protein
MCQSVPKCSILKHACFVVLFRSCGLRIARRVVMSCNMGLERGAQGERGRVATDWHNLKPRVVFQIRSTCGDGAVVLTISNQHGVA